MPRIWYFQKIPAAGYQLCWSRGTWSTVSPLCSVSVFCLWGSCVFSPEFLASSGCMWAEALLSLMDDIFHWATWEWRTCFLFRAQRAQPRHFLAKGFGKEHLLCPSKHPEDIWVHIWQMAADGSACSCPHSARVGLGIVASSRALKSWLSTCMISPHQGMWLLAWSCCPSMERTSGLCWFTQALRKASLESSYSSSSHD